MGDRRYEPDWMCPNPSCGNLNFVRRTECNLCHTPRSGNEKTVERRPQVRPERRPSLPGKGPPTDLASGDWECGECKNINFRKRTACNRCKAPKKETRSRSREREGDDRRDFDGNGAGRDPWGRPEFDRRSDEHRGDEARYGDNRRFVDERFDERKRPPFDPRDPRGDYRANGDFRESDRIDFRGDRDNFRGNARDMSRDARFDTRFNDPRGDPRGDFRHGGNLRNDGGDLRTGNLRNMNDLRRGSGTDPRNADESRSELRADLRGDPRRGDPRADFRTDFRNDIFRDAPREEFRIEVRSGDFRNDVRTEREVHGAEVRGEIRADGRNEVRGTSRAFYDIRSDVRADPVQDRRQPEPDARYLQPKPQFTQPAPLAPTGWYFIDANRLERGPMSIEAFRQALQQGQATRESLCWMKTMASWTPVVQVPGLVEEQPRFR